MYWRLRFYSLGSSNTQSNFFLASLELSLRSARSELQFLQVTIKLLPCLTIPGIWMCLMNKVSWNELPLYLQNYLICLVLILLHDGFGLAFHPSHSLICRWCRVFPDCVTSWQEEEITRRSLKCEIKFLKMTHLK